MAKDCVPLRAVVRQTGSLNVTKADERAQKEKKQPEGTPGGNIPALLSKDDAKPTRTGLLHLR